MPRPSPSVCDTVGISLVEHRVFSFLAPCERGSELEGKVQG
jgi:hypothetical protein